MASLFEAKRPKTLAEVVGQDAAVAEVRRILAKGWGGRSWWITGPSGTGKTTLARIIAAEGADALAVDELDSQRLTPTRVREIVASYATRSLFGRGGKCFIVNEAHGLRRDTMRELLTAIEPADGLPAHICWIFTTTKSGEQKLFDDDASGDAAPLLSRCIELTLVYDSKTVKAFAERARAIAREDGMDLPLSVFLQAVQASHGNMRRVLQRIEAGSFKADAIAGLEVEYQAVKSTKGEYAEARRQTLQAAIAAAKGGA